MLSSNVFGQTPRWIGACGQTVDKNLSRRSVGHPRHVDKPLHVMRNIFLLEPLSGTRQKSVYRATGCRHPVVRLCLPREGEAVVRPAEHRRDRG